MSEPILDLDAVHATALDLARGAGELARRFAAEGYGSIADIDRRMVHHLIARHREHGIVSRESGRHGPAEARVQWLIDPLDGRHNYAMGLEIYGVCLTLILDDIARVAVVHDSASGRSTSAITGQGAWQEGRRLEIAAPRPLDQSTVSWIQGTTVEQHDPVRLTAFDALERSARRVLRTGAPSRDWALLAEGGSDAVVVFRGEAWDVAGGALIAREAGATEVRAGDLLIVGVPATVEELVSLLR